MIFMTSYVFGHEKLNGGNFETFQLQGYQILYNGLARLAYFSITFVINMILASYLCIRAWKIEREKFSNRPIKQVVKFGIKGLLDIRIRTYLVP